MLLNIFIAVIFAILSVILFINKNSKKAVYFFIAGFFISELVFVFHSVNYGLILYSLFLAILIILLLFKNYKKRLQNILIALTILPIARLIGSVMPLQQFSFLERTLLVYSIMFISAYLIFYGIKMSHREIGHKKPGLFVLIIMILLGAVLGLIEYLIIRPTMIFNTFTVLSMTFGLSIFLSGYVEEFIFRGLFQNLFKKVFFWNIKISLLLTNLIFMAMHLIWKNPLELCFVFGVGWIMGWFYLKTKNLFTISILHGSINFFLFIIWPVLLKL